MRPDCKASRRGGGGSERVGEYEDMQTSGSSLILIDRLFTVPGVFIKDLIYKNMVGLKGNQGSLFIAAVPFKTGLKRVFCFREAIKLCAKVGAVLM